MSLYLAHFGLREPPFRITPHTDYFFSGANRGPTLDALIYAITQDEGIVKVTGEVGSGKTMLCRMLLEKLPAQVETLYLANPSLSRSEILGAIADELGVPLAAGGTHSMMRTLQDALVQRYAAGKRVVILIDEAHAMPAESLEEIRLLSNLESRSNKLLQIALFAQPELDARLAANDMRQLRERITQHFALAPLNSGDVAAYMEFRLRAAGYHGPNPFTGRAIERIAKASQGLSRRINILADKALLAAYSGNTHQVDRREAQTAIRDARFAALPGTPRRIPTTAVWSLALVNLAVAGFILVQSMPVAPNAQLAGSPAPTPATPSPPAPPPATPAVAAVVPPATAQNGPTPAAPTSVAAPTNPVAASAAPRPNGGEPAPVTKSGSLTRKYEEHFANWLPAAQRQHYFIQLLAAEAGRGGEVEAYLARASKVVDATQLRVYRSSLSGQDRIGVIFGEFEDRAAAMAALRELPESIRAASPFPRQVERLH